MEEAKKDEPIDLTLHSAIVENINLIQKIKPILDLAVYIKLFMAFTFVVLTLICMRYFGFI